MSEAKTGPIAIAGAGAFGTALAIVLGNAGRPVLLWARDAAHVDRLTAERRNSVHLPDCPLPDSVTRTRPTSAGTVQVVFVALNS